MEQDLISGLPKLAGNQSVNLHGWFRKALFVSAFVLSCGSAWILLPEICRFPSADFSTGQRPAETITAQQTYAHLAALIGYVRGDLWAEYLLTYPSAYQLHEKSNLPTGVSPPNEKVREIAERALSFAPYDSRTWLALANFNSRFDWLNKRASNDLRMSYYTGPNEIDLIPLRLALAVSFDDVSDEVFQEFVRHDIRLIVTRKPEQKYTIQEAYRYALPEGRTVIENTLREVDSTLLSKIKSN